jgi:hypothetical protein
MGARREYFASKEAGMLENLGGKKSPWRHVISPASWIVAAGAQPDGVRPRAPAGDEDSVRELVL